MKILDFVIVELEKRVETISIEKLIGLDYLVSYREE